MQRESLPATVNIIKQRQNKAMDWEPVLRKDFNNY